MTHDYTPRRCGKRWLDGDCPREVLAIIHHNESHGSGFDVIYTEISEFAPYESNPHYTEKWLQGFSVTESGASADHFEMKAHEVAAYRYRFKHRYARWTDLPDAVKTAIRNDLRAADEYAAQYEVVEK